MKKHFLLTLLLTISTFVLGNNVQITNLSPQSSNTITFDISWDNSWYSNSPGANWDAVWVFIKAQDCSTTATWDHVNVSVNAGDHSVAGGTGLFVEPATDGRGVFIRRNSNGFGTQTGTVTLQFTTSNPNFVAVNFRVYGIEMVWVPQGEFRVGDGSTNNTTHSTASLGTNNGSTPRLINNESAIVSNGLRSDKPGDVAITAHNAIPAAFPKGFLGFYCMKYEISQQQYAAFLNALPLVQQATRTFGNPYDPAGTLAMTSTANQNRSSIVVKVPANSGQAAVYDNDLNLDGTYGDGANISCNYLSWDDLLAYLDWSALRPMSELEYEKAARGSAVPILNEYAWGSTALTQAISSSLINGGMSNELSTATGNGLCASNGGVSTILGPLRTGFAATPTTFRATAGASFWGIMDMSGNLWEQTMSIGGYFNGVYNGSNSFDGANGDGTLIYGNFGNHNVPTWNPVSQPGAVIVRGGNWEYSNQRCQTSDRFYVNSNAENASRTRRTGGRGVRRP